MVKVTIMIDILEEKLLGAPGEDLNNEYFKSILYGYSFLVCGFYKYGQ